MEESFGGWENVSNSYEIKDKKIDLIIVVAGGLNEEGKLHEWVIRRLDRAIEIHKLYNVSILCCGGGTYHKPPRINKEGFVIHESTECVNYLIQRGINKNMIYREWSSYDTIANAFFSLTCFVLCNPSIKNISIITSEFHMDRTKEIFSWIYNLDKRKYNLNYESVSDSGLDKKMLEHRKERELKSKENVINMKQKIHTIHDFSEWLYKEHNAYNNNFLSRVNISNECKNSY